MLRFTGAAKLAGLHVAGVVTVNVNVLDDVRPAPFNDLTVTVYIPAGCGLVTRTTPVAGSLSIVPLKLVTVDTLMPVVLVGATSGLTVVSVPIGIVVFG